MPSAWPARRHAVAGPQASGGGSQTGRWLLKPREAVTGASFLFKQPQRLPSSSDTLCVLKEQELDMVSGGGAGAAPPPKVDYRIFHSVKLTETG
jgi:hypothetical protein